MDVVVVFLFSVLNNVVDSYTYNGFLCSCGYMDCFISIALTYMKKNIKQEEKQRIQDNQKTIVDTNCGFCLLL